jgi:hypothetical protein
MMNAKTISRTILIMVIAWFAALPASHAAVITAPGNLNYGDQYRLVFVSRFTWWGDGTDISAYNTMLTNDANSIFSDPLVSALNSNWYLIGSTAAVDARDNTNTNPVTDGAGVPIYNLVGLRVANNNSDLWDGSIQNLINIDNTGASPCCSASVWTGSTTAGVEWSSWGIGNSSASQGYWGYTSSAWIQNGNTSSTAQSSGQLRYLYAMSDTLTYIPLPGTLWLFGSGLLGLIGMARRKAA